MNPILAIDLDGALFRSRPFDQAHKRWFSLMAQLLDDESINEYAGTKDYFEKVHEVMKRYLGNVDHETRVKFARNLYSMVTIAEVSEKDLVDDFVTYLQSSKLEVSDCIFS